MDDELRAQVRTAGALSGRLGVEILDCPFDPVTEREATRLWVSGWLSASPPPASQVDYEDPPPAVVAAGDAWVDQPRDPGGEDGGQWVKSGKRKGTADRLRLADKIDLGPGERLIDSVKISSNFAGMRSATVEAPDGSLSVRLGLGNAAFGSRDDDAGPWRGNESRLSVLNAERKALRDEEEALLAEYDAVDDPPTAERRAELEARLHELDEAQTVDAYAQGYTAKVGLAGIRQLHGILADAFDQAMVRHESEQAWFDELEALEAQHEELRRAVYMGRGKLDRKFTPEEDARWDEIADRIAAHRAHGEAEYPYQIFAEGHIPGEWADIVYRLDYDDPGLGPQLTLGANPVTPGDDAAQRAARAAADLHALEGEEQAASFHTLDTGDNADVEGAIAWLGRLAQLPEDRRVIIPDGFDPLSLLAAEAQTGAMVALVPADPGRLALPGGEPAAQLHTTVAYLGEAADWSDDAREQLLADVTAAAAQLGPISADGFAVSLFNPDHPDRKACVVLGLSGEQLADAHQALTGVLSGPVPEQLEPWAPHITLRYTDDTAAVEQAADRTGPVTFVAVRVAFAGDAVDIEL